MWQCMWGNLVANFVINASEETSHPNFEPMQIMVAQFATDASGSLWWPNLQSVLHLAPFFSCLALNEDFGSSRSKHTTKLMNPIFFTWLAVTTDIGRFFSSNVTNVTTNTLLRGAQGLKKRFFSSNATNVTTYLVLRGTWGLTKKLFFSNVINATTNALLEEP